MQPKEEKHKNKKRKDKLQTVVESADEIHKENDVAKKVKLIFAPDTKNNEVDEPEDSPRKRKKTQDLRLPTEDELIEINKPENINDVGSRRQQKRLKYEKLKTENKQKQETVFQERALNYLSRWKHSRSDWKFEKLRQVWLQNHMFDSSALPEEFFTTLKEYFGGAKGKIREVLINDCMKIVDEAETQDKKEINQIKFTRARTMLQFLQE